MPHPLQMPEGSCSAHAGRSERERERYIYIYIYIYRERERVDGAHRGVSTWPPPALMKFEFSCGTEPGDISNFIIASGIAQQMKGNQHIEIPREKETKMSLGPAPSEISNFIIAGGIV